ncbi:Ring finger domain containing protein [Plasmodiophora brassicae]
MKRAGSTGGGKRSAAVKESRKRNAGNRMAKLTGASSARAAGDVPAATGLAAFRTAAPPTSIFAAAPIYADDGEYARCARLLSKRDPITRVKALGDLRDLFATRAPGDLRGALLADWAGRFARLTLDNSRMVRLAQHEALRALIANVGKDIAPSLPTLAGPWLVAIHDPVASVAQAAAASFAAAFPTPDRVAAARRFLRPHFVAFATALIETAASSPARLGDPHDTRDDLDDRYDRVMAGVIAAAASFVADDDAADADDDLADLCRALVDRFARCGRPALRRAIYDLLVVHPAAAVRVDALLDEADAGARRAMWPALLALVQRDPARLTSPGVVDRVLHRLAQPAAADSPAMYRACPALAAHLADDDDARTRLLSALWAGAPVLAAGTNDAAAAAALFDAYADVLHQVPSASSSHHLLDCTSDALARLSSSAGAHHHVLPRVTFARLGALFHDRADLDDRLAGVCARHLDETTPPPSAVVVRALSDLVAGAALPRTTRAVVRAAFDAYRRGHRDAIALCDGALVDDSIVDDDLRDQVEGEFRRALQDADLPDALVRVVCRTTRTPTSDLVGVVRRSANVAALLAVAAHARLDDDDGRVALTEALFDAFVADDLPAARLPSFAACFARLGDPARARLAALVADLAGSVRALAFPARFADDPDAADRACARVTVALDVLLPPQRPPDDDDDVLVSVFWLQFLADVVQRDDDDDDDDDDGGDVAAPHVVALAQRARGVSMPARVLDVVAGDLRRVALLGASASSSFDPVFWAHVVASAVPWPTTRACFPTGADLDAIARRDLAVGARDACLDALDLLGAAPRMMPLLWALAPSLWALEARLRVIGHRARRLIAARLVDDNDSLVTRDVVDRLWAAAAGDDDVEQLADALARSSSSAARASLLARLPATTPALVPAMRLVTPGAPLAEAARRWLADSEGDDDDDSDHRSALCLARALPDLGDVVARDAVWRVAARLASTTTTAGLRLAAAAVAVWPPAPSSEERADALAWVVDALDDADHDDDDERTDAALDLLGGLVVVVRRPNVVDDDDPLVRPALDLCLPLLAPGALRRLAPGTVDRLAGVLTAYPFATSLPADRLALLLDNLVALLRHGGDAPVDDDDDAGDAIARLAHAVFSATIGGLAAAVAADDDDEPRDSNNLIPAALVDVLTRRPDVNHDDDVRCYLLVWLAVLDQVGARRRSLLLLTAVRDAAPAFLDECMVQILSSAPRPAAADVVVDVGANAALPGRHVHRHRHVRRRLYAGLATACYYRALQAMPVVARAWWSACSDRAAADAYRRVTARRFTPALIADEVAALRAGPTTQEDGDGFVVRCTRAGEIAATVRPHADVAVRLVIRLAAEHPLRVADVDLSDHRGVDAGRVRRWALTVATVLASRNGSVGDAVRQWRRNVEAHFAGLDDCPICYAVVHAVTDQVPRLACRVCKHRFHSACLYKWFASSATGATCPLCRSAF